MLSIALMVLDQRFHYLDSVRAQISPLTYSVQYLVNSSVNLSKHLLNTISARISLEDKNAALRKENMLLHVRLQKFSELQQENQRLRTLLNSSQRFGEKVLIAEVLAVDLEPFTRKLTINKGSRDGAYLGQAVIDAQGILGKLVHVGPISSVMMLITDVNHELPIQVARTGLRTIAAGMGLTNRLSLLSLPNNAKVKKNDILITSGLGGQFPVGYPVGTVVDVEPDIGKPYAQVQAIPFSRLELNREVLLLWPISNDSDDNEIHDLNMAIDITSPDDPSDGE